MRATSGAMAARSRQVMSGSDSFSPVGRPWNTRWYAHRR